MNMKRMSLKREISGILETAKPCETIFNKEWNKEQVVHRATAGNFTCTFATDHLNTREEVVEWLEKRSDRMFCKKSEKINGGLKRQKHMAALIRNSHLLQDLADIRYQHLVNGYSIEKSMRLIYDYKSELPDGVTCIKRHQGCGEWVNVYSIPEIDVRAAMEILPLLPPKYLCSLEM